MFMQNIDIDNSLKNTGIIKATFFTSQPYFNNKQFDISEKTRDNCLFMFYALKKKFEEKGIILSTQDIHPVKESDFVIYNDMPKTKDILPGKESYLLILESVLIKPDNWKFENHKYFKKIFTWDDKLVDNKKYFKINYSGLIPLNIELDVTKKSKFCTMISGHHYSTHPLELYSERINAIRWFEQNHPEDFDLYGFGWDRYHFKGILSKLNRFNKLTKFKKNKFVSYNGTVRSKNEILQKYKFAICYENAKNIPGYITEKIFDCFFAACVPIYWGASNITDYIPENTFINMKNFDNYNELYSYLKSISNEDYKIYLNNIHSFIKSDKILPFSAQYFAERMVSEIYFCHKF